MTGGKMLVGHDDNDDDDIDDDAVEKSAQDCQGR